uniref:SANTA domain-containing protein n=1 Tax=Oryza brachyantha TaxID=4533 RepID=J3LWW1_ORYBR
MLSPSFSRNPLRSSAGPVPFHCDEERPCVELFNWWLERVEGDDRKVRVAGHAERGRKLHLFTSAPIVKRHEACFLEAEDSVIVLINGPLDLSQMQKHGYSLEVCEKFMVGFPYFWERYNLGSQASSCKTSKLQDSSTKFYLEKFQLGNFIDKVGYSFIASLLNNGTHFSGDAGSFENVFYLSNKKPRFEEYACDIDISAKENTTAFNEGNEGSSAVCNKVGNGKIDLIVESTSKDRDHGVTSTEEFTRDETSEQAGNQNEFIHPDVEDKEAASHLVNSDSIYDKSTDNMTFGMGDGSANAGSSVGQGSKEVLATVLPERANFSSDDCLDNILPISTCNSNNCVENQTCLEIAQHITLNEEVVQNEDMSTSVHSDGESLRNQRGIIFMMSSSYLACLSVVFLMIHMYKRLDNIYLEKQPAGPAKEQISKSNVLQGAQRWPKKHVGSAQEQRPERYMSPGATRSPMIRTAIPYAHCSPLTRAKAKSSSVSTPESLELRRTRSGRVVVPPLDPGRQRIIYDKETLKHHASGEQVKDSCEEEKGSLSIFHSPRVAYILFENVGSLSATFCRSIWNS